MHLWIVSAFPKPFRYVCGWVCFNPEYQKLWVCKVVLPNRTAGSTYVVPSGRPSSTSAPSTYCYIPGSPLHSFCLTSTSLLLPTTHLSTASVTDCPTLLTVWLLLVVSKAHMRSMLLSCFLMIGARVDRRTPEATSEIMQGQGSERRIWKGQIYQDHQDFSFSQQKDLFEKLKPTVNEEAEESQFYTMSISLSWSWGRGDHKAVYFILSLFAQLGSLGESKGWYHVVFHHAWWQPPAVALTLHSSALAKCVGILFMFRTWLPSCLSV